MLSIADLAARYDTDKASNSTYLADFDVAFRGLRDRPVALLELGIFHGGSLQLWRDYFPAGPVVGLDLNRVDVADSSGRIRTYAGSQDDAALLDRIRSECAPDGFDIIIDDCSHLASLTSASFWHLYPRHLKPGGIYVIEDWGTGYWDSWPDGHHAARRVIETPGAQSGGIGRAFAGKLGRLPGPIGAAGRRLSRRLPPPSFPSHDHGMVGFVKQLVDESAMPDVTASGRGGLSPARAARIASLQFTCGHVIVRKP